MYFDNIDINVIDAICSVLSSATFNSLSFNCFEVSKIQGFRKMILFFLLWPLLIHTRSCLVRTKIL